MSHDKDVKFDRLLELMEALTRITLSQILGKELDDPKKRKLYDLTGRAKVRDLVQRTGLSAGTISGLWKKWHSMGILKKRGKSYFRVLEVDEG